MAIDPRIAMGIQPIQFDNPLNKLAQLVQMDGAATQNKLANLKMAEAQRTTDLDGKRRNALMGAWNQDTNSVDPTAYTKGLAGIGDYEGLQDFQKNQAAQAKAQADAQKSKLEHGIKQLEVVGQIAGSAKDPASWAAANQQLAAMGIPTLGDTYDPAHVQQVANMALTRAQQLEQQWKAMDYKLNVDKFGYQQQNDAANRSVTLRGQNLTDARGREANQLKAAEVAQGGKPPSGFRWKQDGSLEAIPGGPADKKAAATEGERKAATLLQRLEGSQAQLSAALRDDPGAVKPGVVASGLRAMGADMAANTLATSGARQRVEAAQLDVLDAALTLGTGAAYTREQLEGYRKSYFPQIGDTPATIKDKEARLGNVIEAAKIAAGRAANTAKGGATAPAAGGIKFLGFE